MDFAKDSYLIYGVKNDIRQSCAKPRFFIIGATCFAHIHHFWFTEKIFIKKFSCLVNITDWSQDIADISLRVRKFQ